MLLAMRIIHTHKKPVHNMKSALNVKARDTHIWQVTDTK